MQDHTANLLLKKGQVMIITPARFPGYAGDTANYTEIMNALITGGFKVVLICPKDDKEKDFVSPSRDVIVIRIPFVPPRLKSIGNKSKLRLYIEILLFLIIEALVVLRSLVKFRNYSVLMRHSIFTMHLPILLKLMNIHVVADGELVTDSVSKLIHPLLRKLLLIIETRIIHLYSYFKVSTEAQAKNLIALGLPAKKVIKIPISIDTAKIPRYSIDQIPPNTFGYFGALEPWEGVDVLLEAFSMLVKTIPNALLYVIGEGSSKGKLKEIVEKKNLSASVVFSGGVNRQVLWNEYFQKFRIVVIPRPRFGNSIDSLPSIKLFEALASGKPVIATDIEAMKEVSSRGLILIQDSKPALLAEAMVELITNESKMTEYSEASLTTANCYDIKRNIMKLATALLER